MSDNPAWYYICVCVFFVIFLFRLNEETRDSSPTEKLSDSAARPKSTSKVTGPKYKSLVSAILTVFNCGCCVMMAATGALGVGAVDSEKDIGVVFVGLYMILFAAILFCYETIQIKPCAALDNFYKRNFGFLYGPMGKGLYMFL